MKNVIINRLEWETNVDCAIFSDMSTAGATKQSSAVFWAEIAGGSNA